MKTKLLTTLITTLLCSQIANAMLNNDAMNNGAWDVRSGKFSRTFKAGKNLVNKHTSKNYTVNKNAFNKNEDDITITFSDFSDHLLAGKTRIAIQLKDSYVMDIGGIDSGTKETWVFADPKTSNINKVVLNQMEAEGTAIYDSFGEQGTHVMYSEEHNFYELFDLQDEVDLLFLGSTVEENDVIIRENEYYQSRSPVPLKLDLEFSSVVDFEDADVPGYKIEYTDTYKVVGQGTLKTYDDGESEALKMMYSEEAREYQDGVEISYEIRYEVIFYSKKGHYITAKISDPTLEGEVTLENLAYQKLEQKTASVNEDNNIITKLFPNPVAAGQDLIIESLVSLKGNTAEVYDISGRKIAALKLLEERNNQYKVNVPENLSSGLYFYTIKGSNGRIITNGKIQVN